MIREVESRVQFDVGHVAADAISGLALVGMEGHRPFDGRCARLGKAHRPFGGPCARLGNSLGVVAGVTFGVVESWIVAAGVLMGDVTSRAGQLAACEAAALHQPQRLEANIFELRIVYRRLVTVAVAAESNLLGRRELARI